MITGVLMVLSVQRAQAQTDYPAVDSLTYRLYTEQNWKALAAMRSTIEKDSLSYYYVDLRLGIALYERGQWSKARKYFERAMAKNPAGQVAPDYLFRIYNAQGYRTEADSMFRMLDAITAPRMGYSSRQWLSGIYLEGGRRTSDRSDIAGSASYYFLETQHKLSPRFRFDQSVMFIEQPLNWSDFKQFQYTITPSCYFGKGWEAELTAGLISFRRDVYSVLNTDSLLSHREMQTPGGMTIIDSLLLMSTQQIGNTAVFSTLAHLTTTKKINDLSLNFQAAIYSEHIQPLLDTIHMENRRTIIHQPDGVVNIIDRVQDDTLRKDKTSSFNTRQLGAGLEYVVRFSSRWTVRPALDMQWVQSDQVSEFLFLPSLEIAKSGVFNLSGYYFSKGYYPASMLGGSQVYNNQDKVNSRISATLGIPLKGYATLYLTGQRDQITDAFTGSDYKLNSLYIGAYIKL